MKKLYTLSFILLATLCFGQAFTGTYDFVGITLSGTPAATSNGLLDPTPVPTAPGVTFGGFSAVISSSVVTPPVGSTGAFRFSYVNQPTGATTAVDPYSSLTGSIDPAIYYQVTLTPQSGSSLSLTSLTFKSQRSGTGIRTFAVRSSEDNYATNLTASVTSATASVQPGNIFFVLSDANTSTSNISAGNNITLTTANVTNPITFRFYGWNSDASTGSFSIDDVVFTGTTSTLSTKQNNIAGLDIYPNPVTNGILNVSTIANDAKNISIYDVLGKQVLNTLTSGTTVNVANLKNGVYIVKVTENGKTATRKLVIR